MATNGESRAAELIAAARAHGVCFVAHAEDSWGFTGSLPAELTAECAEHRGAIGRVLYAERQQLEHAAGHDAVERPAHYTRGPIECVEVIEGLSLGYHLGNVIKYVWRAGQKGDALEDLRKARWYLDREIKRRGG